MSVIATTVVSGLVSWWKGRSESKAKIKEAQTTAEIERINRGMDNSGWKDEFILLLIGFPYIMAFIPTENIQAAAQQGFLLIDSFPEWWRYSFLTIVGAVYGSKKLRNYKWIPRLNKEKTGN